jgi:4-diphosphocytidyl-2-C-methyl-D-erythritol kinase
VFFLVFFDTLRFMPKITMKAPAKLNLHLQVGGKRPDGFHELESLFLALAFGDTLCVETLPHPHSFEICMDGQFVDALALPPEKNIVSRAVSLFRKHSGYDAGLRISLEKRIPLGGGLGGGSSDAAATLLALNRLAAPAGKALASEAALAEMGASLGSDVPFFLCNTSAAWVSGKGERIQPIVLPESAYSYIIVLVNPGFPSDTAEAYRLLDTVRQAYPQQFIRKSCTCPRPLLQTQTNMDKSVLNAQQIPEMTEPRTGFYSGFGSTPPQEWPFFNDFLPVFVAADKKSACSEVGNSYQHIIDDLKGQGAEFAGLSGSGSTCFGVFSERRKAETAEVFLLKRWAFVISTFLLAR